MFSIIRGNKCIRTDGTITGNSSGPSCNCVPRVEFPGDGRFKSFLGSEPLKRDNYLELPDVVENDNIERDLLKPLFGLSSACKDWCETIRDFLARECGVEVTSLDKSVFLRTQQEFGYVYWGGPVIRIPQALIRAF